MYNITADSSVILSICCFVRLFWPLQILQGIGHVFELPSYNYKLHKSHSLLIVVLSIPNSTPINGIRYLHILI